MAALLREEILPSQVLVTYKKNADVKPADCSSITELYTFYPVMENTCLAEKACRRLMCETVKTGMVHMHGPNNKETSLWQRQKP